MPPIRCPWALALLSLIPAAPLLDAHGHPALRVLAYAVSAGFEHDVARRAEPNELSLVGSRLIGLGTKSGGFEAVVSRDITSRDASRVSVMPEGLASTLTGPEFCDLMAYVRTLRVPAVK